MMPSSDARFLHRTCQTSRLILVAILQKQTLERPFQTPRFIGNVAKSLTVHCEVRIRGECSQHLFCNNILKSRTCFHFNEFKYFMLLYPFCVSFCTVLSLFPCLRSNFVWEAVIFRHTFQRITLLLQWRGMYLCLFKC